MDKRILVVDHDSTARTPLATLLRHEYLVHEVPHGRQALLLLDEMHFKGTPFSAIVTAGTMPFMDGIELTQRIRVDPSHKEIPVLMYAELSDISRAYALTVGATRFFRKPQDRAKLITYLRKHLST